MPELVFDIVILGGSIIKASGAAAYSADVGIKGETITEIGALSQVQARSSFRVAPTLAFAILKTDASAPLRAASPSPMIR